MDFHELYSDVERLYRKSGEAGMESAIALWYLKKASTESSQDTIDDAINKARSLDPRNTYLFLAEYHHRRNQFSDALHLYLKAFQSAPLDQSQWPVIGDYLLRYGSAKQVTDFFNHLIEIDSKNENARFILDCYAYFEQLTQEIGAHLISSEQQDRGLKHLLVQVVFWGTRYTDIFLDYLLPALCAPGNLPALQQNYKLDFFICTDAQGASRLQQDRFFSEIQKFVHPHVITLSEPLFDHAKHVATLNRGKWNIPATLITNAAHYAVLECARRMDKVVLNLAPDHILSDRCLTEMSKAIRDQIHVLAGPGFRLFDEPQLLKEIETKYRKNHGTLEIAPQEMVKLLIHHLPEPNFVEAEQFSNYPIYLCWRVPQEGIIAHVNHYHPWIIRGRGLTGEIQLSLDPLDGNFLNRHLADKHAIAFAPEAMVCFDLGKNPLCLPTDRNRFHPKKVARWVRPFLTPVHEQYFQNALFYSCNGNSVSTKWRKTALIADQLVKEIIADAKLVRESMRSRL